MKETAHSKLVGTLTREGPLYDYWKSEPISIPLFDQIKIPAVYNCDPQRDATFVTEADSALANFLAKRAVDREAITEKVFKMCDDFIALVGLKDTIQLYKSVESPESWMVRSIEKQGPLLEMKTPEGIWRFVHPQELHLVRATHYEKTIMYVQVLCETDWNEEEGLQIVFQNGVQLRGIGVQDGDVCREM